MTQLLNSRCSLSHDLKAWASTQTTLGWRSAWLCPLAFAGEADVWSVKSNTLLTAFDSIHEVDLHTEHDVFASRPLRWFVITFLLSGGASTAAMAVVLGEHLFKFFVQIAHVGVSSALFPTCEWIITMLILFALLVSCGSRRVVDSSLLLVVECFICWINLGKFLTSLLWRVDIRMELLRQLKVRLLYFVLACGLVQL